MPEHDDRVARPRGFDGDRPGGSVGSGVGLRFGLWHGAVGELRVVRRSADERRRERLSTGETGVLVVPELHGRLAEAPAEQHSAAIELAGKVDQADAAVLELDAEG